MVKFVFINDNLAFVSFVKLFYNQLDDYNRILINNPLVLKRIINLNQSNNSGEFGKNSG